MEWLIIILAVALIIFILYNNGYIPITVKSAVTFIGKSNCKKASFTSCNGYVKRVVKLKGDKVYHFHLKLILKKGNVTGILLNRNKETLLELTKEKESGLVTAKAGEKYTFLLQFKNATGEYELDWFE